jgi:hypothetical protein
MKTAKTAARARKTAPKKRPASKKAPKTRARVVKKPKVLARTKKTRRSPVHRVGNWLWGLIAGPLLMIWVISRVSLPGGTSHETPAHVPVAELTAAQPAAMEEHFARARPLAKAQRVAFWSSLIWDSKLKTAQLDAISPKPEMHDQAPLVPEKFDCTTFVETVMALARSEKPADFYRELLAVRYHNSDPTFYSRNHFPEADWIPNNVKAGHIADITLTIAREAGIAAGAQSKIIRRGQWLAKQAGQGRVSRGLASEAAPGWAAPVEARVDFLPVQKAASFVDLIPEGAVINLVRASQERRPVMITHQGVAVKQGGRTYMRHSLPNGQLKNVPLDDYLAMLVRKDKAWPLVGINVVSLQ